MPSAGSARLSVSQTFKARSAQISHRRGAPEIWEMLGQGASTPAAGCNDFGQTVRRVQVRLDVVDRPLDVARLHLRFAPPRHIAVVVRLME